MKSTFIIFFTIISQSLFSQENIKSYSLDDVEVFPVFYQIEMQDSQKNQISLFKAKLQQFLITNIDSKKWVHFESKSPLSLNLSTTFDDTLEIENTSDFTGVQLTTLKKALEKLRIKKSAQKDGNNVDVSFSIPLQITFTQIKTIK